MLKIENVSFAYRQKKIFTNLSLALKENQITTVIGPNGSGKSTLFKLLTRSVQPQVGKILLNGQDIWQISANKFAQKVAILHQQNRLYDEISVADLVKMGRLPYHSLMKVSSSVDHDKIEQMLDYLGISALKDKLMSQLSGGQQQRVWLAVALLQEPEYLFLDEPTTYLDLHFQYRFLKLLRQLNKQKKLTICMVLHDLNQTLRFSDQVILLNKGEIKESGAPQEVITEPIISKNFAINCELVSTKTGPFLRQY